MCVCVYEREEGGVERSKIFCTSALLTFRNSCLLSLTLTATKNCSIACSTRSFMYFLGSMGRLTEAPIFTQSGCINVHMYPASLAVLTIQLQAVNS